MASQSDLAFMRRAIALAQERLGSTWPNPTVGCVIVRDGAVIADAATGPGGPDSALSRLHAEEQALIAAGGAASGATAFVTLEPCARRSSGRPSCTDRLIEAGVARAVIACSDPSKLAAGQGLERLRAAGVEVESGVLANAADALYAGYLRRLATGRPLVESSTNGFGFDAPFNPLPGEDLETALDRFGASGYTRMWVQAGDRMEAMLRERGFMA
jgi:diaminohydroxyphosphoribosylaminopyrimidine deaminase/5-amino-6-(5-phosphoribosylamino)uracil reductase